MAIPGFQMFLFRRTYASLYNSHYVGLNSFHELLAPLIESGDVQVAGLEIRFANGSKIHGCHCQHEKDVFKYKSAEMYGRILEETTEFTPFQVQYLGTRARYPTDLQVPDYLKPMLPFALYPTNFDDEGGCKEYLCERFKVYEHWDDEENRYNPTEVFEVEGKTCQYIPAVLDDNPSIDKEMYIASLKQLRHPEMAEALITGNPKVTMGSLLPELREHHRVEHFEPPAHWERIYAHDWGSNAPAATIWAAISDGEQYSKNQPALPRGAVYIYKEWLIAEALDSTKGLGYSNKQIAEGMRLREDKHYVEYLTDTLPFQSRGGIPMWQEYADCGITLSKADVSSKKVSVQALRSLLIGQQGKPLFFVSKECEDTYRTLKLLRPHPRDTEKPADHPEDHLPDCVFHIARAWKTVRDKAEPSHEAIQRELNKRERLLDILDDPTMLLGS